MIGSVSKATEVDIVESGTGRGSIGIGSSGSRMGTEIGIGNSTARERGSGTRREGTIGTETGGAGGSCGGRPRVEREQHKEHRQDDDQRREFRRDDECGHHRGREEGSPARRGGGGGGRAQKDAGGGATPESRSSTPEGSVPLSQHRHKASGWDVHALGYEEYSAMQAKQTGRRASSCVEFI